MVAVGVDNSVAITQAHIFKKESRLDFFPSKNEWVGSLGTCWSLPHAVCEAPLLLVSMGIIVVSKGTWYGTTTQAGARGARGAR